MPRRLRFIPDGGATVEVTCTTLQHRFLLKPTQELNEIIVGTLARFKRRYGVRIFAATYLSNHCHLLLGVDHAKQLASFMQQVNSKIAREIGRLYGWDHCVWGRRYQMVIVTEEEDSQVARLRYVLSNAVKEGLVTHCRDWPGVHSAEALRTGHHLWGYWPDRSKENLLRKRRQHLGSRDHFMQSEALEFDLLPCWRHLDLETYQHRIAMMIQDIETRAKAERGSSRPLGARMIRRQKPTHRPRSPARRAAPMVHAATKAARLALRAAYDWFARAFYDAADQLRSGDPTAVFPAGSFPPPLPFRMPP